MTVHSAEPQRLVKPSGLRLCNQSNPGNTGLETLINKGSDNPPPDPSLPVLGEYNEILNVPIRNTVRDDPPHTDSPACLWITCDGKSKTAPDQGGEVFGSVLILPPPTGPVKIGYLFFIPVMDKPYNNLIIHSNHTPYYCLNNFLIP